MQIQINTDSNIEGRDGVAREVEAILTDTLDRFSERITRLEVHLSDENSDKKSGTDDIRCLLEARLADRRPVVVREEAATMQQAVNGAAEKLKRSIESTLGRLASR
jgi:ribosome-associated translation inhibitor RaiA